MISREHRGPDPFLDWKVRIFVTGAVFLLAGIFFDRRELVGIAVVVLLGGLVVRLVHRFRHRRDG